MIDGQYLYSSREEKKKQKRKEKKGEKRFLFFTSSYHKTNHAVSCKLYQSRLR